MVSCFFQISLISDLEEGIYILKYTSDFVQCSRLTYNENKSFYTSLLS